MIALILVLCTAPGDCREVEHYPIGGLSLGECLLPIRAAEGFQALARDGRLRDGESLEGWRCRIGGGREA